MLKGGTGSRTGTSRTEDLKPKSSHERSINNHSFDEKSSNTPTPQIIVIFAQQHPAIGVMGNTNTITLYNKTKEVVHIKDFRKIITDKTVKAGDQTDIDPKEYDGINCGGGRLPLLMIFCGGNLLESPRGNYLVAGEQLFSTFLKTVTIEPNYQNSTGVVNYEVKFQLQHAHRKLKANPLQFSRDSVLDHDYGWSVEVINESVKLTREEGVTMTVDPSKLFARFNDPEITPLLRLVLMFWPRTFADLNRKEDLVQTVGLVNDLMVQAKEYNADRSKGEVAMVMEKVSDLNKLCATKVEWYRCLFPKMEDKFPQGQMAGDDVKKLEKFATTIAPLLISGLGRSS